MVDTGIDSRLGVIALLLVAILLVSFRSQLPPIVWIVGFPLVLTGAIVTAVYVLARVSLKIW